MLPVTDINIHYLTCTLTVQSYWPGCANVTPYNTWFPGPTRLSTPNCISIGTTVFAQVTQRVPMLYNGAPFPPQNCPFTWEGSGLASNLVHDSVAPPKSTSQTASQSVSRFGRPFVKRFALCYRIVVLSACLSVCLSVCGVGVLWPNGWMD